MLTPDFLFDHFLQGFADFDVSTPMSELESDSAFRVANLVLRLDTYDGSHFDVYSTEIGGGRIERESLYKRDGRQKFIELRKRYKEHSKLLIKKKDKCNVETLKRLVNEPHLNHHTEYFIYRPDAKNEVVKYYNKWSSRDVYFVDKKTQALYLLELPAFDEWIRERHNDD